MNLTLMLLLISMFDQYIFVQKFESLVSERFLTVFYFNIF